MNLLIIDIILIFIIAMLILSTIIIQFAIQVHSICSNKSDFAFHKLRNSIIIAIVILTFILVLIN